MQPGLAFAPRPRGHRYIRRFEFGADTELLTDLNNQLPRTRGNLTALDMQFHSQDEFGVEVIPTHVRLDAPFPIRPGITLPVGSEYDYTRLAVRGRTANRRMLAVEGRYETGGFYSGSRRQTVMALTLRARPGYILYLNGEWNRDRSGRGTLLNAAVSRDRRDTVHGLAHLVNNFQFDTSELSAWLAVALPMDYEARKRPLRGLYPQLAGRSLAQPFHRRWIAVQPLKCCTHTGSRYFW